MKASIATIEEANQRDVDQYTRHTTPTAAGGYLQIEILAIDRAESIGPIVVEVDEI